MAKYYVESERLWLQPLNVDDHLEGYHAIVSDERVVSWSHELPSESLEESKAMILKKIPSAEEPWRGDYAILLKPSASITADDKVKMIGSIGIQRIAGDACIVGYSIHPDYSGSGYATEALKLFTESYWKKPDSKNEIRAGTIPENTASQRVLEKAGFQKGALARDWKMTDPKTGKTWDQDVQRYHLYRPKDS